jgi:magnesium transporter
VVSLHDEEIPALEEAKDRWDSMDAELRQQVGLLLHTVVDSVVDAYFPIVDSLEDRLDGMEDSVFQAQATLPGPELIAVKSVLSLLRRTIYPMREVFNVFLRRDHTIFSAETYPYFQDVYDHVLRLLDTLEIERDRVSGLLEVQLSVISNRLNETMQKLTVAAICVAIVGAIFGAWGMNFSDVPFEKMGLKGFWIVFSGTVALVGLFLAWARRRGLW